MDDIFVVIIRLNRSNVSESYSPEKELDNIKRIVRDAVFDEYGEDIVEEVKLGVLK